MIELNDENFKKEIEKEDKLVVVDFFATWCSPCLKLAPILEKVEKELGENIAFMKANVDNIPLNSREFGVDRIPFVVLFNNGKPIRAFIGVKTEEEIKRWLLKDPRLEELLEEYENYARENNFRLNPDKETTEKIIEGLLRNEKKYGKRYCPCRRVTGEKDQDKNNICPCVFHKKEIEEEGSCSCGLFTK